MIFKCTFLDLGYIFGAIELILAVAVWALNPHVEKKDEEEDYTKSFNQDYLSVY